MSYKKFQIYFFIALLVASLILNFLIFRPYLALLAFGGSLAIVARPFYLYLRRLLKSDTAAAFLSVIVITLTIVLPTVYFLAALTGELVSIFNNLRGAFEVDALRHYLERVLPANLHAQIPSILDQSLNVLGAVVERLSTGLIKLFSNLLGVFFGFIVILISLYYLLKDGEKIKSALLAASPLGDEHDELVLGRVTTAVRAVMNGVLIIGLIKGVLAGLAFWAFGIPAPIFWGMMTGMASFLPIFGSAFITIPAVVYLLLAGHLGAAIGLAIVSFVIIGTIDNFLQPKLVESRTKIHPLLILLAILGGLEFFGFAGFILGPLALAVSIALADIYKKEFRNLVERSL